MTVVARGTGLKAGIVGRRAKFNVLTDSAPCLDLHVAILGPNNEVNSERITSLSRGRPSPSPTFRHHPHAHPRALPPGYPATGGGGAGGGGATAAAASASGSGSEDEGRCKVIEDDVGNAFLRQKSVEEELQQEDVVPFDCQCGGEGRFLVTYIPRSPGTYFISVKSHDAHIEGSPFEVKVGPSFGIGWGLGCLRPRGGREGGRCGNGFVCGTLQHDALIEGSPFEVKVGRSF